MALPQRPNFLPHPNPLPRGRGRSWWTLILGVGRRLSREPRSSVIPNSAGSAVSNHLGQRAVGARLCLKDQPQRLRMPRGVRSFERPHVWVPDRTPNRARRTPSPQDLCIPNAVCRRRVRGLQCAQAQSAASPSPSRERAGARGRESAFAVATSDRDCRSLLRHVHLLGPALTVPLWLHFQVDAFQIRGFGKGGGMIRRMAGGFQRHHASSRGLCGVLHGFEKLCRGNMG